MVQFYAISVDKTRHGYSMSKILWYVNRLQMMSFREITWRIRMLLADCIETARVQTGTYPKSSSREWPASEPFSFLDPATYQPEWRVGLVQQANDIMEGKLSYFCHDKLDVGHPPLWLKDHAAGVEGPLNHIQFVDYRDQARFGDCKEVWEPNRHHHLVVLGRAYHVTQDEKYAEALTAQLKDWLEKNPYGRGMNWRSPLELGIRLINWVWAFELIRNSPSLDSSLKDELIDAVYLQCRDVARKFSQGSSANNHLIGEAAGVYIASWYFNDFPEAEAWRAASKGILENEIINQSFEDGCTREHALGYQLFVIQFFTVCGLFGRWYQDEFSPRFWSRLEKLLEFIGTVAEAGGTLPFFGDKDDGYVLNLGDHAGNIAMLKNLHESLFFSPAQRSETCYWLFPPAATQSQAPLAEAFRSHSFPGSGYHLLQAEHNDQRSSVFVDAAELGYESIAAHGHADALSFTMRLNGLDLFVDSGTYDYFSFPEWRNYFRATRAHNTVEIDQEDQSVMQGAFMWDEHANTQLHTWEENETCVYLVVSHNGYERLADPVTHTREFILQKKENRLTIIDSLKCEGDHEVALYFHLHPEVDISATQEDESKLARDGFAAHLRTSGAQEIVTGDPNNEQPALGWYSPAYHTKFATNTVVVRHKISGPDRFTTELTW